MKFRLSVALVIFTLLSFIGVGTVVFRHLEDWSWAESFYFSVATLTTVGYGDIHPTTDISRIFTAFYILLGVGVAFSALTKLGSTYLATQETQLSDSIARRIKRKSRLKRLRRKRK